MDKRGGAKAPIPPEGFDLLPTQKSPPPFVRFWPTDPKIFLKEPSGPICTNFEGGGGGGVGEGGGLPKALLGPFFSSKRCCLRRRK